MRNLLWSGVVMLLVSGCGWNGTPTRSSKDFIPLTSIVISADSSTIAANTTTRLKVTGDYSGRFTLPVTDQVVWSSDTRGVAEFNSTVFSNRVKGVAAGSALLTATVGKISATYRITISSATIDTIKVTPETPTVAKGLGQQFKATGTFSDSTTQDITLDASWSSSATDVATISDLEISKGLATAIASSGTSTITATFGSKAGTAVITDSAAILQSITVTPANSSILNLSKIVNFTAMGTYSDGSTADITSKVAWVSSQPSVATIVSSSGVATTVALGPTSISATLDGVSGVTGLTVTNPVLISNGLKFDPVPSNPLIVGVGASSSLKIIATFTDGTTSDVTANSSCAWDSSDKSKATVISGQVSGLAAGSTKVTATYGGQSWSVMVTVQ